jgi:prepilin-type processing-associated H-X9-DG protein
MTSYNVVSSADANGNPHDVNPGMTSVFTGSQSLPFMLAAVRNPGQKIMLAEEVASMSNGDNPTGSEKVINDGRWVPSDGDPLTGRHGGKGDVTFADFHVEPETWEFGDDITNSKPDL